VCNNLNTHTKGAFYESFAPARARQPVRRIEFCYTPKMPEPWTYDESDADIDRNREGFVGGLDGGRNSENLN
jgi:hypothetical protein